MSKKNGTTPQQNLAKLSQRRQELAAEREKTESDLYALSDSMSERLINGESIDELTVEENNMRARLAALTTAVANAQAREAGLKTRIHELAADAAIKDGRLLFNKSRAKIDAARVHVEALEALGAELHDDAKLLTAHNQTIYTPGRSPYFHSEIGLVLLRASRECEQLARAWAGLDKASDYYDKTYGGKP